jgi:hypothetical protein
LFIKTTPIHLFPVSNRKEYVPNDMSRREMIPKTTRYGLSAILFSVMGGIELWLWDIGHANQNGLYFGLALIAGAVLSASQYIKHRKKV